MNEPCPKCGEYHNQCFELKQLTDKEIVDFINAFCLDMGDYWELTEKNAVPMVRAILRKASEK